MFLQALLFPGKTERIYSMSFLQFYYKSVQHKIEKDWNYPEQEFKLNTHLQVQNSYSDYILEAQAQLCIPKLEVSNINDDPNQ